ncbi:MAG: SAM-dependent DNA methyltransferase [Chloroflexi bacterium]|nr:SAM-dependent DNA methyltransferase [Chloroflexota bacterium]
MLFAKGYQPESLLEPTCGIGNFLFAAIEQFPSLTYVVGIDINQTYVDFLQKEIVHRENATKVDIFQADFFHVDWQPLLKDFPDPLLIVGNPPWVTNSELASIGSGNLPQKNNFQNHAGIDAIMGASNFDISEWMLLEILQWVNQRNAVVALLCKTSVARKVLLQMWQQSATVGETQLYLFDAKKVFDVAVDACVFVYDASTQSIDKSCAIFNSVSINSFLTRIGYDEGKLIANIELYERWKHLDTQQTSRYRWRSGIKHDAAKIMELRRVGDKYVNKLGEMYDLERDYLYPMMKSSDIASKSFRLPSRHMVVTQRVVGESTLPIKMNAPKTWAYLNEHGDLLDNRKSSIYKNRSRFAIFGVGEYAFALWKVAISGLYKRLHFVVVGPHENKPTVLDDTCYFISCETEREANFLADVLNSEPAQQFLSSLIFWDAKRPITIRILRRLDLIALVEELGLRKQMEMVAPPRYNPAQPKQLQLFEEPTKYKQ